MSGKRESIIVLAAILALSLVCSGSSIVAAATPNASKPRADLHFDVFDGQQASAGFWPEVQVDTEALDGTLPALLAGSTAQGVYHAQRSVLSSWNGGSQVPIESLAIPELPSHLPRHPSAELVPLSQGDIVCDEMDVERPWPVAVKWVSPFIWEENIDGTVRLEIHTGVEFGLDWFFYRGKLDIWVDGNHIGSTEGFSQGAKNCGVLADLDVGGHQVRVRATNYNIWGIGDPIEDELTETIEVTPPPLPPPGPSVPSLQAGQARVIIERVTGRGDNLLNCIVCAGYNFDVGWGRTDPSALPDFYPFVSIKGSDFERADLVRKDERDIRPNWTIARYIKESTGSIPITIRMRDEDLVFDDKVDVDPDAGENVDLMLNLSDCSISGELNGRCGQTLTYTGTSGKRARVEFRIEHSPPPPPPALLVNNNCEPGQGLAGQTIACTASWENIRSATVQSFSFQYRVESPTLGPSDYAIEYPSTYVIEDPHSGPIRTLPLDCSSVTVDNEGRTVRCDIRGDPPVLAGLRVLVEFRIQSGKEGDFQTTANVFAAEPPSTQWIVTGIPPLLSNVAHFHVDEPIVVTSNSWGTGGPECTLRDAITAANTDAAAGGCQAGKGPDVISLEAPESLYRLRTPDPQGGTDGPTGLPSITTKITINGNGATVERASGSPAFRVLHVAPGGDLTLNELTVLRGFASGSFDGGGIFIAAGGVVKLIESSITRNSASVNGRGGGIFSRGQITLASSIVDVNLAEAGAGVYNDENGVVELINSTVSSNYAAYKGGGIYNAAHGTVELVNSTLSSNTALGGGGGIHNQSDGAVGLANSIVSKQIEGGSCSGRIVSRGYNLVSNVSAPCDFVLDSSDMSGTSDEPLDPVLIKLKNHGGPTRTHALHESSPAIDQIPTGTNGCSADPLDTDQRGVLRPADGDGNGTAACDIGSFELQEGETAIDLLSFTARPASDRVLLAWETGSEVDTAGFNVWRSEGEEGEYVRINEALIPAEGDPESGASYTYTDTGVIKGITYYYKLEDVDIHGASTFHGPVSATPGRIHRVYLPLVLK